MDTSEIFSQAHAKVKDEQCPLRGLREHFVIPSKSDLSRSTVADSLTGASNEPSTYLCGNSLGLQPQLTAKYFEEYLKTWRQKGVFGHFKEVSDTHLPPWLHADDDLRLDMANVVGAHAEEVAVMQTLTANLHLLMCSFYQPTKTRNKILLEGRAFPSDHFVVESQIHFHGYDPNRSMLLLEPESSTSLTLSTEYILSTIDKHANELALVLLPGIQYYTGQFFDIKTITAHAQAKGIVVGWDLAHAAGNVPLQLHDWNVDFAAWCTYKYLNSGPGSIGGCFVHERHSKVESATTDGNTSLEYRPRLSGWWGSQKSSRFTMDNTFEPIPGAAGFQVSNPSVADCTAVRASLDVFKQTSMSALRGKSLKLTGYLEKLLDLLLQDQQAVLGGRLFHIITPRDSNQRGAQLSVMLQPGLLDTVMAVLEEHAVVVDERKPDVIRVAPAPLYNTYEDVRRFIEVFRMACEQAVKGHGQTVGSVMVDGGKDSKGWSAVK